jgi:hypothetical protein
MALHPKVLEAFKTHWENMGLSKKQVEAAEKDLITGFNGGHSFGADLNWNRFETIATRAKQPVKEEIFKVYRQLNNEDGREYMTYAARYKSKDALGNPKSTHKTGVGYYEVPIWERKMVMRSDGIADVVETDSIVDTEAHYEIEWTPENLKRLSKNFVTRGDYATRFYIFSDNGQKKFQITQEDFCNTPRAELIARLEEQEKKGRK